MKKKIKIISGLVFVEAMLTVAYFYYQPPCEPCLPGMPCAPCISEEQVVIYRTGVSIAVVLIGYVCYVIIRKKTINR
jgi:hypothetical protein